MPALTSISSAAVNKMSDCLTSLVFLAQYTPPENDNLTENRLQIMERNISSLWENFK